MDLSFFKETVPGLAGAFTAAVLYPARTRVMTVLELLAGYLVAAYLTPDVRLILAWVWPLLGEIRAMEFLVGVFGVTCLRVMMGVIRSKGFLKVMKVLGRIDD